MTVRSTITIPDTIRSCPGWYGGDVLGNGAWTPLVVLPTTGLFLSAMKPGQIPEGRLPHGVTNAFNASFTS